MVGIGDRPNWKDGLDDDMLREEELFRKAQEEIEAFTDDPAGTDHDDVSWKNLKTLKDIVPYLETVENVSELEHWIRGPLFKPKWLRFTKEYVLPCHLKGDTPARGVDHKTIVKTMANADYAGDRKFTQEDPDTTGWGYLEWSTQLFSQVLKDNEIDRDGIFYQRHWSRTFKENLLGRIFAAVRNQFSPTRLARGAKAGGWHLLGVSEPEIAVLHKHAEAVVEKWKLAPPAGNNGPGGKVPLSESEEDDQDDGEPDEDKREEGESDEEKGSDEEADKVKRSEEESGDSKGLPEKAFPEATIPCTTGLDTSNIPIDPALLALSDQLQASGTMDNEAAIGSAMHKDNAEVAEDGGLDDNGLQGTDTGEGGRQPQGTPETPAKGHTEQSGGGMASPAARSNRNVPAPEGDGHAAVPAGGKNATPTQGGFPRTSATPSTGPVRSGSKNAQKVLRSKAGERGMVQRREADRKRKKRKGSGSPCEERGKRRRKKKAAAGGPKVDPLAGANPGAAASGAWRKEVFQPMERLRLTRQSEKMNMNEDWWKWQFINYALNQVAQLTDQREEEPEQKAVQSESESEPDEGGDGHTADEIEAAQALTQMQKGEAEKTVTHEPASAYDAMRYLEMEAVSWNEELRGVEILETDTPFTQAPLIVPTEESIKAFDIQQSWFDNTKYQRENVEEACKAIHIKNPKVPKLRGMRPGISFHFWQHVGVYALMQFRRGTVLKGCICADGVGLGKTFVSIGFIIAENHEKRRRAQRKGVTVYFQKPHIVIGPPHLVWQWAEELARVCPWFTILVYFGDARDKSAGGATVIRNLTNDDPIFDGTPGRKWVVVVTSLQTIAQRHGPSAFQSWQKNRKKDKKAKDGKGDAYAQWPKNLAGKFEIVLIDEAHSLRNLNSNQSVAIANLAGDFNVLLTATPLYNCAEDFKGLVPFLIPEENDRLWDDLKADPNVNPFQLPDDDSRAILRLTRRAIDRFVWADDELRGGGVGHHIGKIWEKCMLRRGLFSRIPFDPTIGKMIGDSIPPSQRVRFNLKFHPVELAQYKAWERGLLRKIICKLEDGRLVWHMGKYRELSLLTSWLWFRYVEKGIKGGKTRRLVNKAETKKLAKEWAVQAMKMENSIRRDMQAEGAPGWGNPGEGFHKIPKRATDLDDNIALQFLLKGSPKLRMMLQNIRDEVLLHQEKSVVWCGNPGEQVYVAAGLILAGIDCRVFHAELDSAERQKLTHEFTTDPKRAMVFVCSYYVNSAGSNLQNLCRNVHLFAVPMSEAMLAQAVGRVQRLGQTRIVKVYEYVVEDTFNSKQLAKNINKVIPNMVAELNSSMLGMEFDDGNKEIDLGSWGKNADGTISHIREEHLDEIDPELVLVADDVIYALLDAIKTGGGDIIRPVGDWEKESGAESDGEQPKGPDEDLVMGDTLIDQDGKDEVTGEPTEEDEDMNNVDTDDGETEKQPEDDDEMQED